MSKDYSPNDVLENYRASFPDEIGDLFYNLFNQVSALHIDWKNYRSLYGTSPERIMLLNSSASSFFRHLERIMRHYVIMAIARLTDRAQMRNKENASLQKLLIMIKPHVEDKFYNELESLLSNLEASSSKARKLRNAILAHSDFAVALHYNSEPIEGISREEVENILGQIRVFMNEIEFYFKNSQVAYEQVITSSDAERLLKVLSVSKTLEKRLK